MKTKNGAPCQTSDLRSLTSALLSAESWETIFQQTLLFANYQVRRLRWRGQIGGVLPGGFDPNSIAAQAIMEFLQQGADSPSRCEQLSLSLGERVGPPSEVPLTKEGAIMEFLQQPSPSPPLEEMARERRPANILTPNGSVVESAPETKPILWEIKRLVLKQVNRLHHLKENRLLSNEPDLAMANDQDNNLVNPLEFLPAPDVQPDEALIRKESFIEFHQLKFRFEMFLANEQRLRRLFELHCDGIAKPQTLAVRLRLDVRAVENLQKRLQRKWLAFRSPRERRHLCRRGFDQIQRPGLL